MQTANAAVEIIIRPYSVQLFEILWCRNGVWWTTRFPNWHRLLIPLKCISFSINDPNHQAEPISLHFGTFPTGYSFIGFLLDINTMDAMTRSVSPEYWTSSPYLSSP